MSGILTGPLWKNLKIQKRIIIDIIGFAALFIAALFLLTRFTDDPSALSIQNWAYRIVTLSCLFLAALVVLLILLLKMKKKILPYILFLIYLGHAIGVLTILFFSVDELYGLDFGLGGGVTLGIYGILLIIAVRDLLGDMRELTFWQEYWSELKDDRASGKLSSFWKIVLFLWQPKFTKEESVNPIRDFAEGILMAFVLALIIRTFSLEAYKIPTGSMKPTLVGESVNGDGQQVKDGDKILVDKIAFSLRGPKRFEIIVFKYPLNSIKNFIKRCVGMPEEEMVIYQGDIWRRPAHYDEKSGKWVSEKNADFELVKKSWREQEALWSLYYSYKYENSINNSGKGVISDIYSLKLGNSFDSDWTPTTVDDTPGRNDQPMRNRKVVVWSYDDKSAWKTSGEGQDVVFEADVTGREPSAVGFSKFINDRYTLPRSNREYETYSYKDKKEIEQNDRSFIDFAPVADAKFRAEWSFGENSAMKIQYHRSFEDMQEIWVELSLGTKDSSLIAKILDEDSAMKTVEYPGNFMDVLKAHNVKIKPGQDYIVDLAYVDGDVVVAVDHKFLLRWSLDLPFSLPKDVDEISAHSMIPEDTYFRLIAIEGKVSFKHPEFWRDIYYRPEGICNPSVIIPEKKYFALGDNCTNSKDSRLWYVGIFKIKQKDGTLYELRTEMDPGSDSKNQPKLELLSMNRFSEDDFGSSKYSFELSELRRRYDVVNIEDIYGVVHSIPTESIESFEVQDAPYVPFKNLLGKALVRFWPLLGMKFAR